MEKLSLIIAEEQVELMTDSNFNEDDDCFADRDLFVNNFNHGFIVITQLKVFIESFINTILTLDEKYDKIDCSKNMYYKLEEICKMNNIDYTALTESTNWHTLKILSKVRNSMIHFNDSYIGHSGGIGAFVKNDVYLDGFFSKDNILDTIKCIKKLSEEICELLGYQINSKIDVFISDGLGDPVTYIYK